MQCVLKENSPTGRIFEIKAGTDEEAQLLRALFAELLLVDRELSRRVNPDGVLATNWTGGNSIVLHHDLKHELGQHMIKRQG